MNSKSEISPQNTGSIGWPTTQELQTRLTDKIHWAMRNEKFVIIPSPTSSGKSWNAATTSWKEVPAAGGQPVIHFHGTKSARKEAVTQSDTTGVRASELLGRNEACDTCAGKHDNIIQTPTGEPPSEWFLEQVNNRGNTLSNAHSYLEEYNGGELPCCPCPSVTQWEGVPYDDNGKPSSDVVHATDNFAYVPSLIHNVNVFWDERPDFKRTIGERKNDDMTRSRFQDIIVAWLKEIEAPVSTWEEFVMVATHGDSDGLCNALVDPPQPDVEWYIEGKDAHTLAPALTEAAYDALTSQPDRNGRRTGSATSDTTRFDASNRDDPRYSRTRITLIIDDDNHPTVYWNVPEMGNARSIICLDAWPSIHEWKQNVGNNLEVEEIVTDEEFVNWRLFERGLEVIQIGDAARPAATQFAVENYTDKIRQEICIESLRRKYGEKFQSAIFPKALEDQMKELLPDDFITITRGQEKSNNSFSDESIGLVTNCLDPGDGYVLDLLAARGLDAEPEVFECVNCDDIDGYDQECPICEGKPNRKPGRGFIGPDSNEAEKILRGIRDYGTAQAVGRWARKEGSPRALVFVRTSTIPDKLVDLSIESAWKFSEKQKAIVDYLRDNPAVSTREIANKTGVGRETVRENLIRLIRYGVAKRDTDPHNQSQYLYLLIEDISEDGVLNLSSG